MALFLRQKKVFEEEEEEVALARVTIESFKATAAAADQWGMGAL